LATSYFSGQFYETRMNAEQRGSFSVQRATT
jgi:hypothetical protein